MKCSLCDNDALPGLESNIGPLCKQHAFSHMGIPITEGDEEASCRRCRRLVKLFNAAYIEDSGFWHENCLEDYLRNKGECPKHGTNPRTCGCWGDPIKRLVEQASSDAQAIWRSGGRHELCSICLRFNRATTMGLPLYAADPQRADEVCGSCFKPICWNHVAHPPKDNILGLSTDEIYCSGGWVSNCYDELKEKVACAFEDCETTQSSFREPDDWDPIVDSSQCEDCGAYYCDYVGGHEQCPECKGVQCDHCSEIFDKEDLYSYQKDSYDIEDICEGCLEEQHQEDEERAFGDYFTSDFKDAIKKRFAVINLDVDIDDVDDDLIEELIRDGMEECNEYIEHHSEGPHLDLTQIAECIDPYRILSLPGATADGFPAGPNASLTARTSRALRHLKQEFDQGSYAAHQRAAKMRRSTWPDRQKKSQPMTRKRRAALREHMRQSMKKPFWYRHDDPHARAMKKAPKTIKGMKPFLGLISRSESRARIAESLRKERKRKRPNPFFLP